MRPRGVTPGSDGDVLDVGDAARVIRLPGHTGGSVALFLPGDGVLFTGHTVAASPVGGTVVAGRFNLEGPQLLRSLGRLAALDVDVACFGHGDPVVGKASTALRKATDDHPATG